MKRRSLLLTMVAGLTLTGCSFDDLMFWKKVEDSDLPENTLREFDGYRLATKVKNKKRYLLGDYRHREDLMRFANGDYHRDDKGFYPFYMGTVGGTTEGAAEFEVKFTNIFKGEFSLQCFCEDTRLPWHEKYIGVYAATSSFENSVMSIALLDDPKQTTYEDPKEHKEWTVSGICKFYKTYEGMPAYAPAIDYEYPGIDLDGPVPKFLGSSMITDEDWGKGKSDYISMDAKRWEDALTPGKYDLGHLYEKI